MDERSIEFEWDDANVARLGRHQVQPEEAEQVILNDPLDVGMEFVKGEERYVNLGGTSRGRILLVVTTWRADRIRVVRRSSRTSGSSSSTTKNEAGDRDGEQEAAAVRD